MTDTDRRLAIHPLPWRVEEDWTAEVRDATGDVVCKLPSGDPRAYAIVAAANDSAMEQDARRYRAIRWAIAQGLSVVLTDDGTNVTETFVGDHHDPPTQLDQWADQIITAKLTDHGRASTAEAPHDGASTR
jgi:hypothetical protein